MMRRFAPLAVLVMIMAATVLVLLMNLDAKSQTQPAGENQQSILAGVISQVLSSPDITVRIGAVEGVLSSKSVIRDVVLSDAQGPFLNVGEVQLEWRRAALLSRRLEIDRLVIQRIDYARKPVAKASTTTANEPLLPELPLKLVVKTFELGELILGEAVLGQAARLSGQGRLVLGAPSEGLDLDLELKRLDLEGLVALKLLFVPKGETLDLSARANEAAGGLIAHMLAIPDAPPVALDLTGAGPLDVWNARLGLTAGPGIGAVGAASLRREGAARAIAMTIKGRIGALVPSAVARLFAGETDLTLRAMLPDTGWTMDVKEASLATPALQLGWSGQLGPGVAEGKFSAQIADVAALDSRLKGAASLTGTLQGPGDAARMTLDIKIPLLQAAGRHASNLSLAVVAQNPFAAASGTIQASGIIEKLPLMISSRFARSGEGVTMEDAAFSLGMNRASGRLLAAGARLEGQVSLALTKLDQLSPVFQSPLSGAISGDASFNGNGDRLDLRAKLTSSAFSGFGTAGRGLKLDLDIKDILARPLFAGTATAESLSVNGNAFGKVSLGSSANETSSEISLDAKGGTTTLSAAAGLEYGSEIRINLKRLSAQRSGAAVKLIAPASVVWREGTVSFERLGFQIGGGTLDITGRAGRETALKLRAAKVPLGQIKALSPGLDVAGMLDAEADLSGDLSAPSGQYTVSIRQFSHPGLRQAAIPALDIRAKGALSGARASIEADISGGKRLSMRITGSAPLDTAGALDLATRGTVDASLATPHLAANGQRVSGQVAIDASLQGTMAAPRIGGSATVSGGSFVDPLQGLRFTDIQGRISGAGDALRIERMQASTPGGGRLAVTGSVIADPARGLPADLKITGQGARLVENDVMILVADLDLSLTGPVMASPTLGGVVRIGSLDIMIPDRLASAAAPLPNTRHIAPPEQTRARLAMIEKARQQRAQRRANASGGARLSIRLDAPNRIAVRGRGIDAELGGTLTLAGTLHAPRATGAFELRRGQLDMLTQRLQFSRGRITFNGDIVPEIDFLSSTSSGAITAKVAVTGRADEPIFTLASEPQLPPDEVLARLMFDRAAGSLSPFQAIQLAQAVARLAGKGGPDFLDRTRRALGVDTLDVDFDKNGPRVGASRYITRDIRLGVKTGATPEESGLSVNVDVTRRIKLQGEATKDGRGSVGIAAEIEY